VQLIALTLEHFKSYIKPTRIVFDNAPGLRSITGRNEVDAELGSNGAGKSSIFDALEWCLHGVTPRKGRASRIVSQGHKRVRVKAELRDDDLDIVVERTAPPERLTINGEPVSQADLDAILGGRDRFLNSVVFGQTVPMFLDRSEPERRAVLDDVLPDLGMWLELSEKAAVQAKLMTAKVATAAQQVRYAEGKLAGIRDEAELVAAHDSWLVEQDTQLTATLDALERAEAELDGWAPPPSAVAPDTAQDAQEGPGADIAAEVRRELDTIITLRTNISAAATRQQDLATRAAFYRANKVCPTCGQPISQSMADHERCNADADLAQTKLQIMEDKEALALATARHQKLEQAQRDRDTADAEARAVVTAERAMRQRLLDRLGELMRRAEQLGEAESPYLPMIEEVRAARREAEAQLETATTEHQRLQGELIPLEFWKQGFKRVQLFLINRILGVLELEANTAASSLGLHGWTIKFATESETKSGTVRSGITITVERPGQSGECEFSPGELQRARLSISFGLGHTIDAISGMSWDFLVLDEPSSSLSVEGVEDLLESLQLYAQANHKCIYLVEHHVLAHQFDQVWLVTKNAEGSKVTIGV